MQKKCLQIRVKKEYTFIDLSKKQQIIGLILIPIYIVFLRYFFLEPLLRMYIDDSVLIATIVKPLRNAIMLVAYVLLLRKNIFLFFKDVFDCRLKENCVWVLKSFLYLFIARISYSILVVALRLIMKERFITFFGNGPKNEMIIDNIREVSPVLVIVFSVIFAPILEELVFRYVLYHALRRINKYLAFIIVPVFFSIIHLYEEIWSGQLFQAAFYMLSYLTIAIPLTIMYEKRRNILFCIVLHACSNLLAEIL